jgi:hypothetical protein
MWRTLGAIHTVNAKLNNVVSTIEQEHQWDRDNLNLTRKVTIETLQGMWRTLGVIHTSNSHLSAIRKNTSALNTASGIRAYATGRIIDRPTLALMGEAGMNEAVVPLPNGRSIPVDMHLPAPQPNQSFTGMIAELQALRAEVRELKQEQAGHRDDQRRQHNASYQVQRDLRDIEQRREVIGMPATREEA